jgi:hypothetical protein
LNNEIILKFKIMAKKTVPVKPHKRSTPSPTPRKNPDAPKPGPKTVPVKPHKRTPPND